MSRQGFACHSTGPIFDWIFRATFFPIQLPSPFFSLSLSAEWFSSIQFLNETARHKRVSLLFYFIIFIFIFSFPNFFLLSWYLYYMANCGEEEGRGVCRRLILLLRFISLETNCPPTFGRTFCANFKELFGHWSVLVLHVCVCERVCVYVCVLTWPFIRSSSSAYATNFSFRLRCVLS